MTKTNNAVGQLIVPVGLSVLGHVVLAYLLKRTDVTPTFLTYFALFGCYIYLYKQEVTDRQLSLLILVALLLRLIWLPAFPRLSDDYARFVWDGRLLANAHNPFFYLPQQIMETGHPATSVDQPLYNALNSQTYYTCYPPLLQALFGISSWLFPTNLMGNLVVLRVFIFMAEVGSILLLIRLLPIFNQHKKKVLLYALNPLVIAELTGNFHFEALVIFFVLGMLYCIHKKQFWWGVVLFTFAVISKLVPLIFLPVMLLFFGGKKGIVFCLGVLMFFILSFLPFIDMEVIRKFWSSINSYFVESEFNASVYYVVRAVVDYYKHENMIEINGPVLSILSALLIFVYAFLNRNRLTLISLPKHFIWMLFIFLVCTTTVHPWYVVPLVAYSCFTNYRFPIVWSALIFLSYFTYRIAPFEENTPLLFIEYGCVFAAVIVDLYQSNKEQTVDDKAQFVLVK